MDPGHLDVSSAVLSGGTVPREYTCDGAGHVPPLAWGDPPAGTRSFAVVVHDPDAPRGGFVHWLVWNIPPDRRALDGVSTEGLVQGTNGFGRARWGGPCPPRGHGPHRYHFVVHALDRSLDLAPGVDRRALEAAMGGHVLARGEIVARYEGPAT